MNSYRITNLKRIILDHDMNKKYIKRQKINCEPDPSKTPIQRHADAYVAVMDNLAVNHLPGELIAGNNGDKFSPRPRHLLQEELESIRDFPNSCSERLLIAIEEQMFYLWPFSDGHVLPDYQKVLSKGARGILSELSGRKEDPALTGEQKDFLDAAERQWKAVLNYVDRHRKFFLEKAASSENNLENKKYYEELASNCAMVPLNPATTFCEALQSIWFTHIATQIDDVSNHSLGRLDQYLLPYYENDISKGLINAEEARELFLEFWLKFNLSYKISEEEGIRLEGQGLEKSDDIRNGLTWLSLKVINEKHLDDGQTVDLCGTDSSENDATNEISWLALDALRTLKTFEPKPVIKQTDKTDKNFLASCYEIIATGLGLPAISYHDAGAKGMKSYDNYFEDVDIENHSHIGCVELGIPGMSYTDPMNGFINLPKIVLVAMNNGYLNGRKVGILTKPADTWNIFFDNFFTQLKYFVSLYVEEMNRCYPFYAQFFFRPLVSTVVQDCIAKATPIDNGGSKYWAKSINCVGFASAINSLYAIKELVYKEEDFNLDQLCLILEKNFAGEEDLRLKLLNRIPKYGNGIDEVDSIANMLVNNYSKYVRSHKNCYGGPYRPGIYSFYEPVKRMGKATGATPDGRKQGDILSLNSAPSHGSINNGLSAILQSVTSFPHSLVDNASTIDIHLNEGIQPDIIKYINEYLAESDVLYAQYTVVKHSDLLNAKNNPSDYRDLVVRVTGFSARFVSLDEETQNEIIKRSYWQ